MLKQEYAQHIAEMSQRVRCEEWAELEKNKEDFFETGNTWALSWLGHLTVLDAAMYHYTGKAEWLERVKECLGIFFSVQDELVQRYEDGSLPFIYKQEDGKPIEGPSKNPLEVLEENDIPGISRWWKRFSHLLRCCAGCTSSAATHSRRRNGTGWRPCAMRRSTTSSATANGDGTTAPHCGPSRCCCLQGCSRKTRPPRAV